MTPKFDDEKMAEALDTAGGDCVRAAVAVGCSPATMYAFKRRWNTVPTPPMATAPATAQRDAGLIYTPPAPTPAPTVLDPPRHPAPTPGAAMAQLHATTTEGIDRSAFDVPCDEVPDVPRLDPNWIERPYFARMVARLDRGARVQLIGHAGGGKTMSARQYAAMRGLPFIRISLENSADLRAKWGRLSVVADGGAPRTVFVESQLLALCERGDGAVVLFDEDNMVDAGRLAILNEILDSRIYYLQDARGGRGRTVHIPDAVRLMGACNPPLAQFVGAQRMNAALANRFDAHIEVPPLSDGEIKALADRFGAPAKLKDAIVALFSQAQRMVIEQSLRVQVSIRNLASIVADVNAGLSLGDAATESILNACIATGDTTGREALAGLFKTVLGKAGV